jgi:hypothetical protein
MSCKSQSGRVNFKNESINQVIVDSVAYKIIKDSIYCKAINSYYHFKTLDVKHPNKKVEDSINSFFFLQQYESIADVTDLKIDLNILKNKLSSLCNYEYDVSTMHIDTGEFDVVFNDLNIFSLDFINYDVNGRGLPMHYGFSLKTGKLLEDSDIFNNTSKSLIDNLKTKAFEILKEDYKNLLKNDTNKEEAMVLKELIDKNDI